MIARTPSSIVGGSEGAGGASRNLSSRKSGDEMAGIVEIELKDRSGTHNQLPRDQMMQMKLFGQRVGDPQIEHIQQATCVSRG